MNTGTGKVGIAWSEFHNADAGGERAMATDGAWGALATTAAAHRFCLVALDEPVTVALALVYGELR